ncbi:hypothetical protein [Prescottella equi]|uniref:Uncharacterized protein n=1 Tax=Rhodococcus phage REQ2 TaxID=1109713 RepID=G9FGZ2_9CAUD|nr:hypothetical protein [Prescottella equi]YP_005087093.1 hypothetical protein RoPhREQ2_gp49 [Rhodococcus phage REQ2]AEV51903.1 hypothetical protein [Rhodococcus phage REQ2]
MTTLVDRGRLLPDTCLHFDTFATTDHVGPLEYCADCRVLVDHYDGAQSTPEQGGGAMRGFWNALVIWGCLMAIFAMLVAIGTGWWWV